MHPLPKTLVLLALIACAGCAKPSDATDGALSTLSRLAIASVLLNVVVLPGAAVVAFRRRNR